MAKTDGLSSYLESNYGLTDSILDLDKTDPKSGFTLKEAIDRIANLKLADNAAGRTKAANILAKTNWFKTYGVEVTERLSQEKSSPGVFKTNITNTVDNIKAQANVQGFELSDAEANDIARDAYIYGSAYNSNKIIARIASVGDVAGGLALSNINALKEYGANMGVAHDEGWYVEAARNIGENKSTSEEWKSQINDVAKSKYGAFATQIDSGLTVKQVASPYLNSMANILEVSPDTIGLSDPTINKALTNLNKDSQPALQPLWQFETDLRKDPRWATTKNARDTVDNTARKILSDFGLVS